MTNKKKKKKVFVLKPEEFENLCQRIILGGEALLEMLFDEDDGSMSIIDITEAENAIQYDTERLLKIVSIKFGYPLPNLTLDEQYGHFGLAKTIDDQPESQLIIRQAVWSHT